MKSDLCSQLDTVTRLFLNVYIILGMGETKEILTTVLAKISLKFNKNSIIINY